MRPVALARATPTGTRPGLRALVEGLSDELTRFADVLEQSRFAPDAAPRPLGPMVGVGR